MAKDLEIELKNLEFVQNICLLLKDVLNDKNIPKEICMGDFQERKHCFVRRTQSFAACAASKLQNCFQSHAVISWGPSRRA